MRVKFLIIFYTISLGSCGIIIPDELTSLLSVAYSNIPPVKKGTDTRVGIGFAFGNNADFQVMLELGPQTETQSLNGQGFQTGSNKREAPILPLKVNKNKEKFHQSDAGNHLQSWANKMRNPAMNSLQPGEVPNLQNSVVELVKNDRGEYEIHQPKPNYIRQSVLDNLKTLYGQKKYEPKHLKKKVEQNKQDRTAEEVKKITEDLSNVDID